jgi:hypothetical protein
MKKPELSQEGSGFFVGGKFVIWDDLIRAR